MKIDFPLNDDFASNFANAGRIAHELKAETDRGVVLVVAAFLDEQLEMLLTRHFIDDAKVARELLSNNGPLATFSSRIKLAYCLDLMHPEQYSDLQIIRKIRNEFAHSHTPADFSSDRVRDLCANLGFMHQVPDLERKVDFSTMFDEPETTRNQFIANALALFCGLTNQINMSTSGVIDAIRFVERDMRTTGGEHLQRLIDEFDAQ